MSASRPTPNGATLVCLDDGDPITLDAFYATIADLIDPEQQPAIEAELWLFGSCRLGNGAGPEFTLRLVD